MARKITRKNFYMEIRRNFGRFISILFIVALGVAFFSGIRASEPSMRITGDAYFDESDLMDIKAVSTLGITKEDVSAVGNVKGVGKAEGAYSADFLNIKNKKQYVLHVMSAMEDMNKITVREGRMPEKAGECLVDDQMNYKIGETIQGDRYIEDGRIKSSRKRKFPILHFTEPRKHNHWNRYDKRIRSGSGENL